MRKMKNTNQVVREESASGFILLVLGCVVVPIVGAILLG